MFSFMRDYFEVESAAVQLLKSEFCAFFGRGGGVIHPHNVHLNKMSRSAPLNCKIKKDKALLGL